MNQDNIMVQFHFSIRKKIISSALLLCFCCSAVYAETSTYEIRIKDHLFLPSKLSIPVDKKVKLVIINDDSTPEEFESYELNREKVIMGNRKGTVFIGPLKSGIYPFFGEFNPSTAQGSIEVK